MNKFTPLSPKTEEEVQDFLAEHARQQKRQELYRQLYAIRRTLTYQTIRHRAMQRVGLKAMMICLIGHGTKLLEDPKRLTGDELRLAL